MAMCKGASWPSPSITAPWRKRRNATPNAWTLSDGPGIPATDSFFRAQQANCAHEARRIARPPISPGYQSCCALAMRYSVMGWFVVEKCEPSVPGKITEGSPQVAVPLTNDLLQDWPPSTYTPYTPTNDCRPANGARDKACCVSLGAKRREPRAVAARGSQIRQVTA